MDLGGIHPFRFSLHLVARPVPIFPQDDETRL